MLDSGLYHIRREWWNPRVASNARPSCRQRPSLEVSMSTVVEAPAMRIRGTSANKLSGHEQGREGLARVSSKGHIKEHMHTGEPTIKAAR
jgi:hypothetical protein